MLNQNQNPMITLFNDKFVYSRELGWNEYDSEGDLVPAMIVAVDAQLGYNILKIGAECKFIEWVEDRDEAIEIAVDKARNEISIHEMRQLERD